MSKLFKLANKWAVELKDYREKLDSDSTEDLVAKALKEHEGEDIDLSYNNQHYGWFIWDEEEDRHEQRDLNDFKGSDNLSEVRRFVSNLKKVKLEDYK